MTRRLRNIAICGLFTAIMFGFIGVVQGSAAAGTVQRCVSPGGAAPPAHTAATPTTLAAPCPHGTVEQPTVYAAPKAAPLTHSSVTPMTFPAAAPAQPSASSSGSCPALAGAGADYCWVTAYQYLQRAALGATASFTQAQPVIQNGDSLGHSLAEIWVSTTDHRQAVEVGWGVFPSLFGDKSPHLWVYHWVNGVGKGYNANFVQVSTSRIPGMVVTTGNLLNEYAIEFYQGNWWVQYQGEWIGYFPGSLWGGAFTSIGEAMWYGEVASSNTAPATAMGNGVSGTTAGSARVAYIGLIGGPALSLSWLPSSSANYALGSQTANGFSYGGPGFVPPPAPTSGTLACGAMIYNAATGQTTRACASATTPSVPLASTAAKPLGSAAKPANPVVPITAPAVVRDPTPSSPTQLVLALQYGLTLTLQPSQAATAPFFYRWLY